MGSTTHAFDGAGEHQEWLVTDSRGAFAMGTASGLRTRKYHGFYLSIAGRSETSFLADLDLRLNGRPLWPHRYESPTGPVIHPDPLAAANAFDFEETGAGPRWRWELPEGKLAFAVEAGPRGGIRLSWKWQGSAAAKLEIRPFWAMRPLHGMGGEEWTIESAGGISTISGRSGQEACFTMRGAFDWRDDPQWYRQFHYSQERARGYLAREDLYSAGVYSAELPKGRGKAADLGWDISESRAALEAPAQVPPGESDAGSLSRLKNRARALDFVLREPDGIVAGFPWFGEWGRDTFISLPGIAMAWIRAGGDPDEVWAWAESVLMTWGRWIQITGMIPNLIEKGGSHQWESADGTLWWTHALASLWSFSVSDPKLFPGIEDKFRALLSTAVDSIHGGRHLFLVADREGLLEVTEPHSTWMDARVEGAAVTPRTGRLPEINALWFQARCLQWIWSKDLGTNEAEDISRLGRLALGCRELDRPNQVFQHSIPLAPSFVLKDGLALATGMQAITESLWTPAGLRTLSPRNAGYRPRCEGDQLARDRAYHQGPPWGWLGGHYEMARERWVGGARGRAQAEKMAMKPGEAPFTGSIPGHLPELFDAEPPFAARGTPAQAWSIACFEEAAARRRGKVDAKLTRILAKRWLDRLERPGERPADAAARRESTA